MEWQAQIGIFKQQEICTGWNQNNKTEDQDQGTTMMKNLSLNLSHLLEWKNKDE